MLEINVKIVYQEILPQFTVELWHCFSFKILSGLEIFSSYDFDYNLLWCYKKLRKVAYVFKCWYLAKLWSNQAHPDFSFNIDLRIFGCFLIFMKLLLIPFHKLWTGVKFVRYIIIFLVMYWLYMWNKIINCVIYKDYIFDIELIF